MTVECLVTVMLPVPLRARADNQRAVRVGGRTVGEVIDALDRAYPGLGFSLCDETGKPRQHINVFVNGENTRILQGLDTPTPAEATIHILPSVSGG